MDVYPTRWILLLDDSSGATIEVTCARQVSAATVLKDGLEPTMHGQEAKSGRETAQVGLTATGRTVDLSGVDVGVVVKVKGGVGVFRGAKQVVLERICKLLS